MTTDIPALLAEARKLPVQFQAVQLGETQYLEDQALAELDAVGYLAVYTSKKLADALEAEHQRADSVQFALDGLRLVARSDNAYLIGNADVLRAERDRYRAAIEEVRDWMINPEPVNWLTLDRILTAALGEKGRG